MGPPWRVSFNEVTQKAKSGLCGFVCMRSGLLLVLVGMLALAGCIAADPVESNQASLENDTAEDAPLSWDADVLELRERVHAAIEEDEPVVLDARPVQGEVWATLGAEEPFEVVLEPSPIVTNQTWAEVDGERVDVPFVEAFEGHVVDAPDWPVRLTITEDWARGYILGTQHEVEGTGIAPQAFLLRVNLDGNLPHDAYPDEESGDQASHAKMQTTVPGSIDHPAWPEQDCLELVPPYLSPVMERPAEHDQIESRIVLDGDAQFKQALGEDAFPMMVAMMQETDAIYQVQVNIRYTIEGLHLHTDEEAFPDPGEENPFNELSGYWNERTDVERDTVHLFTGQDSSYAMANCIGGAGIPDLGYTFTPLNWERDTVQFHTTALAHELGHIFSAHHHHGNHAETHGNLATIMIQGYTPGYRPTFSSMSDAAIRGWADAYLGEDPTISTPPGLVDAAVDRLEHVYAHPWDQMPHHEHAASHGLEHAH